MADRSDLIFVNADSDYECSAATDSLVYASYKTANFELTDALLGDVTNLMIKSDGSRPFTAVQTGVAGVAATDLVIKSQLDAVAAAQANLEFQDSVIDKDLTAPPGSPTTGDRYLIGLDPSGSAATGAWAGQDGAVAEWDGSAWQFTTATTGMFVSADDENTVLYYYNGTIWQERQFEQTTASLGVEKIGSDIRADLLASGGIKLVGNELAIEPTDFAGAGLIDVADDLAIDWSTAFNDAKAVKAEDINATTFSGFVGADSSGISQSSANDVQGVLDDISDAIDALGTPTISYTAGTGGITKGQLIFVSANDTGLPVPISGTNSEKHGIGIANETVAAAASFDVAGDDTIVTGVLTALTPTAGDKVFWDGSALTLTAPSSTGSMVWMVGVAKNANDLHVDVERVKRNS